MLLPIIGVISIVLSLGFAYALPLEDYIETPTKRSVDKILKFCADNTNATLTNETIMSLNLSQFYSDYTCDEAKQAKSLLKSDNPNANNSTTVTMIH
jgi:hypothetical protein